MVTTRARDGSKRIAIVGAGVAGLGSAVELTRRGHRVTLFDGRRAGSAASWAAGGMLAPVAEAEVDGEETTRFHVAALGAWPEFAARLEAESGEHVGFEREGIASVALTPYDEALLERRVRRQRAFGLTVEWQSGEEARREEPLLSPRVRAATRTPEEGTVDPRRLLPALVLWLVRHGAELREEEPVREIVSRGGRVRGVRTDRGECAADEVVLAAGAWSGEIAGLPEEARPAVRPVLGQMVCLRADRRPLARPVRGPRAYLVPRPDGRLLVGATIEERGFDERVTAEGVRLLLEGAFEVLPATAEMEWAGAWCGLRPATRDAAPVLGRGGMEGLVYATGHYRNGILSLPLTARAVADAVEGEPLPEEARPFEPGRSSASSAGSRP
jgi:glycine oxidase